MTSSESKTAEGHLQRRMSRLTMVALTFAILKYVLALTTFKRNPYTRGVWQVADVETKSS